jgi:predicted DNA-binding helix-hairpin-helix protein
LYQADWLLRFYGYKPEELLGEGESNLPTDIDPKTAWALRHPEFFPVDVDRAEYYELLRVPGIGVTGAGRIISTRRESRLRPEDLPRMGIAMKRARWFLASGGRPLFSVGVAPSPSALDPFRLRILLADAPNGMAACGPSPASAVPQLEFSFG